CSFCFSSCSSCRSFSGGGHPPDAGKLLSRRERLMRIANCVLVLATLLAFAGCGGTGTPGGPGTKTDGGQPDKRTVGKPAEETFTIDVPLTSTKVKQGESKSITFALKREANFDE